MIIPVELGKDSYNIVLEKGARVRVDDYFDLDRKVMIVTDSGIPTGYSRIVQARSKEGFIATIPEGDESKNLANYEQLIAQMLDAGFTKADCVVAVGGGVVGDFAGFVAATFLGGIDFYYMPTTLMAQADCTIGGRCRMNLGEKKDAIGVICHPKAVVIDPDSLNTLEKKQLSAAMAEIIKMAVISDASFFHFIEYSQDAESAMANFIIGALQIKKAIVKQDIEEPGTMDILGFGHTIGRALETLSGGDSLHGENVAMGMLAMCAPEIREELAYVFNKFALPIACIASNEDIKAEILKENEGRDTIEIVYVSEIGSCEIREIPKEAIDDYLADLPR